MNLDLGHLDGRRLEAAADFYEKQGYLVLGGVDDLVAVWLRPALAEAVEIRGKETDAFFRADAPSDILPLPTRQRLARIPTGPRLTRALLSLLEPLLIRLIGPLVHVSSTFHGQVKGAPVKGVDHGGYRGDYLEVQGPYLLHQDFTGANIPTSPSGLTLWAGLNSCPDWPLRLYPGSHRLGLLCNRWLGLDEPGLAPLGQPIDIQAQVGRAVVFNAMLLHGTGNPGPSRRLSSDIRFFPFCGFLPTEVHPLGPTPGAALAEGVEQDQGPVLRAPLLETQVFLGRPCPQPDVPRHSVLNWVNYLDQVMQGRMDAALAHLARFANEEVGFDTLDAYAAKFHGRPVHRETLMAAQEKLAAAGPDARILPFPRRRTLRKAS